MSLANVPSADEAEMVIKSYWTAFDSLFSENERLSQKGSVTGPGSWNGY
ncbi:hypothetical protein [Enterococcus sp. BWR-S5]|nr:hypothetical protein [Enterococcus sp. BWR-S5]MBL1226251.1 hypothetical protein [Enterococcus sp. BWR-S5]